MQLETGRGISVLVPKISLKFYLAEHSPRSFSPVSFSSFPIRRISVGSLPCFEACLLGRFYKIENKLVTEVVGSDNHLGAT